MKLTLILSAMLLLTLSCERTTCGPGDGSSALQGKWKFTQYYMSIGTLGPWQPAPGHQTIQFNTNGTVNGNVDAFGNFTHYKSPNDSTVVFIAPAGEYTMLYKINGSMLEINPICNEGCGYQFTRQ